MTEPIARFVGVSLDCADPGALADFYLGLLGGPDPRWRVLLDPAGHPFCITSITPPEA